MADSRTRKDTYMNSLREQLTGVSPQNSVNSDNGVSDNDQDYYELLKNESYKTMLTKEVQAYNAKQQALKYANNGLNSNGYGTQGVSESARLGIGNTYSKALRDAQNEYDDSLLNIAEQQRNEQEGDFESFASILGSASSTSQLSDVLTSFGYIDENGEWSKDFYKLDKKTQSQIKSMYALYYSEFENSEWLSENTINGVGYRDSGTAIQNIATADGSLGAVSNELKKIFSDSYIQEVEKRTNNGEKSYAVKLENGSNSGKYVYMIYRNGTWYQTTASAYNKADIKGTTLKGEN